MNTVLIKNIKYIVTCDDADNLYRNGYIYAEDGVIKEIGEIANNMSMDADEIIDGSGMIAYPGLINTHHHLYQYFTRNLPQVQRIGDSGKNSGGEAAHPSCGNLG